MACAPAASNARHRRDTPSPAVATSPASEVVPWRAALEGAQDITTCKENEIQSG